MPITIFDIVICIILIWTIYQGFKDGVVVQLGGIVGLILGVYFAFRFGSLLGEWLHIDPNFSTVVGFIIVLFVIIIGVGVLSHLLSKIFSVAGLGILNKLGGVVFALLKAALILGLFLCCFDYLNRKENWVDQEKIDRTVLYRPLIGVANIAFPYIDFVTQRLINDPPEPVQESDTDDRF